MREPRDLLLFTLLLSLFHPLCFFRSFSRLCSAALLFSTLLFSTLIYSTLLSLIPDCTAAATCAHRHSGFASLGFDFYASSTRPCRCPSSTCLCNSSGGSDGHLTGTGYISSSSSQSATIIQRVVSFASPTAVSARGTIFPLPPFSRSFSLFLSLLYSLGNTKDPE